MATKGSAQRSGTKSSTAALDRLGDLLDAAQQAINDLRRELSKGGRDVLKDLETLLRDARNNLQGAQRTLIKDLEEVHKAATGKRRGAAKGSTGRATTTTKGRAAAAPKPARRSTRAARET